MSREINGKIYKDKAVKQVIINGKEVQGNKISAEDNEDGVLSVTIIAEDVEEES